MSFTPATALAEARIALAKERQQPQEVVAELTSLVKLHQAHVERVKALTKDRLTPDDLTAAQATLLELEIRLLREQQSSGHKES
mgnify:CR=1 FL=1